MVNLPIQAESESAGFCWPCSRFVRRTGAAPPAAGVTRLSAFGAYEGLHRRIKGALYHKMLSQVLAVVA
jgi:hypothetical protein